MTDTHESVHEVGVERLDPVVRLALRDTVPVAMGYIPLGAAYGLLMVDAGLDWYWAPLSSVLVFAGAMQFLSVPLLAAGIPLLQLATTTLVINFRHVFYGLSFPLRKLDGSARRAYGVFALTDETYSLIAAKAGESLSGRRILFIQLFSHAWWIIGSTIGAVASMALPSGIQGIEFALTALFVVLAQEHFYKRENARPMLYGAVAGVAGTFAGNKQFLTVAMAVFLVMVAAEAVRDSRRALKASR
ncbi:AzlC family ABC transporter permease [Streptomyces sp. NBC_01264]|uniref:AzlC family ABC transporter permease n=1 Tax=Streptomyces sp. NBC_01264 TaxID=2903804 RepID=UPI002250D504|nr:AzlC family ABC transporter permease [Streptomyces sp. NBC_01264]MCX4778462.1 AzlC family ABC transporter permease [Streptomyces sp. NBC_01264]